MVKIDPTMNLKTIFWLFRVGSWHAECEFYRYKPFLQLRVTYYSYFYYFALHLWCFTLSCTHHLIGAEKENVHDK